jgi:hypothetical protein
MLTWITATQQKQQMPVSWKPALGWLPKRKEAQRNSWLNLVDVSVRI